MIQSDLDRYNEWWLYGKVRQELVPSYKRLPFSSAWNLLNTRQIAILTGLRRVGKTTILYQLISKLLESHDEKNVMYYSFEEKGDKTRDVLEAYEKQVLRRPIQDAGRLFIFLDEVQYSPDWVYTVKRYYDLYPNIKFYLSGSSSLLLGEEALDKLAGRFFFLDVYPLTFKEFMQIKGVDVKEPSSALEPYFSDYLTKAGFPEIVNWQNEKLVRDYVRSVVIDRVISRDLLWLYGRTDRMLLERILLSLISNPGSIVNLYNLSKDFGTSRITVSRYLSQLESTLVLRSLSNYRPSSRSSSRKLKKYYPATTSLIYSLSPGHSRVEQGRVLETYVVNSLRAKNYYRKGNKEIDALVDKGKLLAVEVKEKVDESDARRLYMLSKQVGAEERLIVSWSQRGKVNGVQVIPAYALEWILGLDSA